MGKVFIRTCVSSLLQSHETYEYFDRASNLRVTKGIFDQVEDYLLVHSKVKAQEVRHNIHFLNIDADFFVATL